MNRISNYIEREYLVDHIHTCMENDRLMKTATKEEILQMVADMPSEDVQPVVHGEWINIFDEDESKCSECGKLYYYPVTRGYKYCPSCGAKMDKRKGADE